MGAISKQSATRPNIGPFLGEPGPAVCGQRQPQAHPDQPIAKDPLEPGGHLPGAGPPADRQPVTVALTVQVGNALGHKIFNQ
jgi:hypothetical protein